MNSFVVGPEKITYHQLIEIFNSNQKIELSDEAKSRITKCRKYLDKKIENQKEPIYGVTTGFGSLCNHSISTADLQKLQENLVMSHACGVGEEVPEAVVKLMLLLKIKSLSYGNSGVQLQTVQRLCDFYNHNILPIVYQQGSLGASGDLAPLAHLCLPLIGMGEITYEEIRFSGKDILKKFNWEPIALQSKEGLALLNGTQFMSAFAVHCLIRSFRLSQLADVIAAISLEAFDGRIEPFHELIQKIRPHKGQAQTAERIRQILIGSQIIKQTKAHVQDPYSFRCVPQVHGATKDALTYISNVISNEINAVTDNPTIFPEEDLIISAGNFHGQPLALVLDYLSIAIAELGSISERRTYQLIGGKRNLPSFLVANPGLNSGFMIPQYTAASIVSQNKQLCTPSSADSIESSQGQEDHVSMGANAATKAYRVIGNVEKILAIELFNAAQALEFRKPLKSSPFIEKFVANYREHVPFISNDCVMFNEIQKTIEFIKEVNIDLPLYLPEGL